MGLKQSLQSFRDITYRKKYTFAFFLLCISPRRGGRGGGEKGRFLVKVEEEASPNPQVGGKMPSAPAQNPAEGQQWYG